MSGRMRARGCLGGRGRRRAGSAASALARQSLQGIADAGAAQADARARTSALPDLRDVRGQESAKRALEVAAAGGHNLLMIGPPGSGKSMLAARLPSILPPLSPEEMLEVSMVHSLAGELMGGKLCTERPFRAPHHSAGMAALVRRRQPAASGEVSLAHLGVLFLDELPEFQPNVLDALRQPLETGEVIIARADHRIGYPARVQLIGAMNPCRCGTTGPGESCKRGPRCAADYQARISGPLLDRIDLQIEVPAVNAADLVLPPPTEGSARSACARGGGARAAARSVIPRAQGGEHPHQCRLLRASAGATRHAGRSRASHCCDRLRRR